MTLDTVQRILELQEFQLPDPCLQHHLLKIFIDQVRCVSNICVYYDWIHMFHTVFAQWGLFSSYRLISSTGVSSIHFQLLWVVSRSTAFCISIVEMFWKLLEEENPWCSRCVKKTQCNGLSTCFCKSILTSTIRLLLLSISECSSVTEWFTLLLTSEQCQDQRQLFVLP